MAQFTGGKFNEDTGVLSYMYGGKGKGKGRGGVSIKEFDDGWYFVDEQGKIRNTLGDGGKLTKTHIDNLNKDKIFDSVPKPDIDAGEVRLPSSVDSGEDTVPLAKRGNLSLRDAKGTTAPNLSSPNRRGPVDSTKTLERRGTVPAPAPVLVSKSPYEGGSIGPEGVNYEIPPEVSLPDQTTTSSLPSNLTSATSTDPNLFTSNPSLDNTTSFTSSNNVPINTSGGFTPPPYALAVNENSPQTNYPISTSPDTMFSPANEYTLPQATNMTSNYTTGWSPGVESSGAPVDVMQEGTTTPGIVDQKDDSPWGSAAGWQAAGSVMKGVGGLYGAWTGMKNYQLARDAHATQKNQWQQDYTQRLEAYKDNKALANQEIDARNRTLRARGQGTVKDPIIQHI